jgi:hypothetical protein
VLSEYVTKSSGAGVHSVAFVPFSNLQFLIVKVSVPFAAPTTVKQ